MCGFCLVWRSGSGFRGQGSVGGDITRCSAKGVGGPSGKHNGLVELEFVGASWTTSPA